MFIDVSDHTYINIYISKKTTQCGPITDRLCAHETVTCFFSRRSRPGGSRHKIEGANGPQPLCSLVTSTSRQRVVGQAFPSGKRIRVQIAPKRTHVPPSCNFMCAGSDSRLTEMGAL
jgi:hypothetical protein